MKSSRRAGFCIVRCPPAPSRSSLSFQYICVPITSRLLFIRLHVRFRYDNDNRGEVGARLGALNAHCPRYKMHRHPYYVTLLFIGNSRAFREERPARSIPASNDDHEREFRHTYLLDKIHGHPYVYRIRGNFLQPLFRFSRHFQSVITYYFSMLLT